MIHLTVFYYLLLFITPCFSTTSLTGVPVGSKNILPKSPQYHFSNKSLVSFHSIKGEAFFVAKKAGSLQVQIKKQKLKFLILDKKQQKFFDLIKPFIDEKLLDFSFKKNHLSLTGRIFSKELSTFILESCIKSESSKIILNISPAPPPSPVTTTCLGEQPFKPKVNVSLIMINKNRFKSRGYGLGGPSVAQWGLNSFNKLEFQELIGELSAGGGKGRSKEEFYFESSLSTHSPLVFETGSEVGVQNQSFLSRAPTEWRKALTNISIKLLSHDKKTSQIELDLSKSSRTSEKLVFQKEKFNQTLQVLNNKWVKLLSFTQDAKNNSKRNILALNILGKLSKSKSNAQKELWILLEGQ